MSEKRFWSHCCPVCGDPGVEIQANVRWDMFKQDWEITDFVEGEEAWCGECGEEVGRVKMVSVFGVVRADRDPRGVEL